MSETQTPGPAAKDHGMRTTLLVLAALAVIVTAAALLASGGDKPDVPVTGSNVSAVTGRSVTYQAEGTVTKAGSYTLRTEDGGTVQGDVDLPMKNKNGDLGLTFTDFSSGDFVYFSIQNSEGYGSITCRIIVDGKTISENTSSGGYKIATCQSRVP